MIPRRGALVLIGALAAGLIGTAVPVAAQEQPADTMLVTYASPGALDGATADGGALDRADDGAAELAPRVAVAELTPTEAAAIESLPGVVAVEPDAPVYAAEAPNDECYTQPLLSLCPGSGSWHVDRIGLPAAWDRSHGAGATIAVIDSGVQTSPVIGELTGKLVSELDATGGTPPCTSGPVVNHGTAVATLAGARTNNGADGPGAGWDAPVLSVRVWGGPSCSSTSIARIVSGITVARQSGATVLNISATSSGDSPAMHAAVDDAVAAGLVVVAAAGNSNTNNPGVGDGGYPANYPSVLSVGATNTSDARSSFSNYGSWVDVYAPGEDLTANSRNGGRLEADGTSFAAPIVAGVVALMRSANPGLTPAQIADLLVSTAVVTATAPDGTAVRRIDAAAAVARASCSVGSIGGAGIAAEGAALRVAVRTAIGRPCTRVSPGSDRDWAVLDGLALGDPDLTPVSGGMIMAVRGGDNRAYLRFKPTDGDWGPWAGLGGQFSADLSVVSWAPGRLDIFGRGLDGALWHNYTNDGVNYGGWESLGGSLGSEPDVSSWAANRLDVFVLAPDGSMYHRAWNGSTWLGWEGLGGGFRSGPGALSLAVNRIDVAARGLDDQLWIRSWTGSAYTAWTPLGGALVSNVDLGRLGGNLAVVARGTDQRLWQRVRSGSSWLGWTPLP